MSHLSDVEFVDLVDGTLPPARTAHVEGCPACQETAAELRGAIARAADDAAPEPSPLFWEHFSARVHDAVRDAGAPHVSWPFGWMRTAPAQWGIAAAALTVALVAGLWMSVWPVSAPVASPSIAGVAPDALPETWDASDPDADEAWGLVRTVADETTWDEAASEGIGVRPGSAERALATLTVDERSELARLLQAETRQPGA